MHSKKDAETCVLFVCAGIFYRKDDRVPAAFRWRAGFHAVPGRDLIPRRRFYRATGEAAVFFENAANGRAAANLKEFLFGSTIEENGGNGGLR